MAIRHYKTSIPAHHLNLPEVDLTKFTFFEHSIFDDTTGHHICDIRPAYELVLVGHSWDRVLGETDSDTEQQLDQICIDLTAEAEISRYMYCSSIAVEYQPVLWDKWEEALPDFVLPDPQPGDLDPPWVVFIELAAVAKEKIEDCVL